MISINLFFFLLITIFRITFLNPSFLFLYGVSMKLLDYPKQYWDMYFCGKNPKTFKFKDTAVEFLGVLVFLAVLQIILILAFAEQFVLQDLLLGQIAIPLIIFGVIAGAIRITFSFFKGKSTFQKDTAVLFKYASGFVFLTGVAGFILTLFPIETMDTTILTLLGVLFVLLTVYLLFAIWPSLIGDIAKAEKVKQPKANLITAFSFVLLIFVVFVVAILFLAPHIDPSVLGGMPAELPTM